MLKKLLFTLLFAGFYLYSSADGIVFFKGTYAEVQKEAKKQNKLIFIDCFTTWCGPCNRMARDVFPKKEIGDYFNEHFICYKLDMEKGEGLDIAKAYVVKSYPTYLFLNSAGELEHRTLGSKEASLFLEDGKIANDPERNLQGLAVKFVRGNHDTTLLHQLIIVSTEVEPELNEKALSVYWDEVTDAKLVEKRNWDIFVDYEKDINSKAYIYINKYRSDFDALYGADAVSRALFSKAGDAVRTAAETKNEALFKQGMGILDKCQDKEVLKTAGMNVLRFYRKMDRWKDYVEYADPFLAKYGTSQEIYNSVAWEIFAHSTDHAADEKALVYAQKSMQLEKNYGNTDTWANVLFKLKRYKEAEKAAKEAIALAKKEKLDYTSTQELLDKTQKSLAE